LRCVPAFRQPQNPRRAKILTGDGESGWEDSLQVCAQPVEQPPLIAAGSLVIAAWCGRKVWGLGPGLTSE